MEILKLLEGAKDGSGNEIANIITGNTLQNVLSGLGGNDRLEPGRLFSSYTGVNDFDKLSGGTGADTFVLHNGSVAVYKGTDGDLSDYADLTDFSIPDGDRLELIGDASHYFFLPGNIAKKGQSQFDFGRDNKVQGDKDVQGLFYDVAGDGIYEAGVDSLIATLPVKFGDLNVRDIADFFVPPDV